MKKVKFTLGLMLAILFFGANVSYAAVVLQPERGNNYEYGNDKRLAGYSIPITYSIEASSFYANSRKINDFWGENDAIEFAMSRDKFSPFSFNPFFYPSYLGLSDIDANKNGMADDWIDLRLESVFIDYLTGYSFHTYGELDSCAIYRAKLTHYFTVKLSYDKGKEVIPFLRRTIMLGKWMYDPDANQNVWVENGEFIVEDLLVPLSAVTKTQFTDGTGVATYTYDSEIVELYMKYPIHSIHYDLWVNDEMTYVNGLTHGEGNAYVFLNRSINIDAAAGITTNPKSGMILVESGKDFTFDVSGEAGKELLVSASSNYWTVANGGIIITPNGSGKWQVTIKKVRANLTLKLEYAAVTESGAGDADQTGNGSFTEDKVWGSSGTLYVKSAGEGTLSVYSVTGQLSKNVVINGDYTTTMPKGIYIVKLKGKAYKVIL